MDGPCFTKKSPLSLLSNGRVQLRKITVLSSYTRAEFAADKRERENGEVKEPEINGKTMREKESGVRRTAARE